MEELNSLWQVRLEQLKLESDAEKARLLKLSQSEIKKLRSDCHAQIRQLKAR